MSTHVFDNQSDKALKEKLAKTKQFFMYWSLLMIVLIIATIILGLKKGFGSETLTPLVFIYFWFQAYSNWNEAKRNSEEKLE